MGAQTMQTTAVIGLGLGATMLLCALAETEGPAQKLVLLDPGPLSAEAYAAAAPEHFLNTRARVMGLSAGQPEGFIRFVSAALGVDEAQAAVSFAPRGLYHRFLRESLEAAIAALQRQGWTVRRLRAWARGVARTAEGWTIDTDRGPVEADRVVLAIGPERGEPFAEAVSPWALEANDAKAQSVLVIGAGLTAADAVARLIGLGEVTGAQGRFTLVTPGPGLPLAQSPLAPAAAGAPAFAPTDSPAGLVRAVRRAVRDMVGQGHDWRAAMDALRPLTPTLWAALPAEARRRLLQSRRMLAWSRHRHRLPPQTAEALAGLQAAGRLAVLRDRVVAVEGQEAVFQAAGRRRFDLVIDARGFDLSYARNGLVQQMIAARVVAPCPTGFGLHPNARYQVGDGIYAMGAVLSGALLESTAAPEIRAQAGQIADALREDALRQASCPRHQ